MNPLDTWYSQPDPWGYQTNNHDINRKERLIMLANFFGPFERCLDIGAGEGWITKDYPAKEIHGYEKSDLAAARFPPNVGRPIPIVGKYDLVCATGVFYAHYPWDIFLGLVKEHASKYVLVSSIRDWEVECVEQIGTEIARQEYPYREFIQCTRVFRV